MMPIINIHPLSSEEKAESFRLTLKDADKFGLYCCHDGTSAMWSVIPKIALDLIFNAETALPVTERQWVGLTLTQVKLLGEGVHEEAIKSGDSYNWVFYKHINEALKEKNNA